VTLLPPFSRLLVALGLALTLLVGPRSARAEAPDAATQSRALFREASQRANAGEWQRALELYRAAYASYPHATTLFNIGYSELQLGELTASLYLISRALDGAAFEPPRRLSEERRGVAEATKRDLLERLAVIRVRTSAAGLSVRVDGRVLAPVAGESPASFVPYGGSLESEVPRIEDGARLLVEVGEHKLSLASGEQSAETTVTLRAGEAFELVWPPPPPISAPPVAPSVALATKPPPPRRERKETPPPKAPDTGRGEGLRTAGYASLVVGGVGLLLAGVSAAVLVATDQHLDSACPAQRCPESESGAVSRYQTAARLTNVGLVTGVAGAAVGTGLLVWSF